MYYDDDVINWFGLWWVVVLVVRMGLDSRGGNGFSIDMNDFFF